MSEPWIITASGERFYPFDSRSPFCPIVIDDVAHALSNVCRWGGHTREFYNVAQHSVYVAREIERLGGSRVEQFAGLLHDASEAYLGDVCKPLKESPVYRDYRAAERWLMAGVADAFGLPVGFETWQHVRTADTRIAAAEARDLLPSIDPHDCPVLTARDRVPEVRRIVPWSPRYSRVRFLESFRSLSGGGG